MPESADFCRNRYNDSKICQRPVWNSRDCSYAEDVLICSKKRSEYSIDFQRVLNWHLTQENERKWSRTCSLSQKKMQETDNCSYKLRKHYKFSKRKLKSKIFFLVRFKFCNSGSFLFEQSGEIFLQTFTRVQTGFN